MRILKNKITAVMKNDDYIDIAPGHQYEVEKVFSSGHIKLKNGQRRYLANSFELYNKGERITFKKAYMLYKLQRAIENVRMK